MTGTQVLDIFQNFQVTIPEGKRFWEDDSTGVTIKQGQLVTIGPRQFRSAELRFALLRNQVLIKSGVAQFVFKEKVVKVTPGNKKNIIEELGDRKLSDVKVVETKVPEVKNEQAHIEIKKPILQEKAKEVKKINKKPDLDDIPDLEEE